MVGGDAEYCRRGVNEMMDEGWGHGLNDFGDGHPVVDFAGEPRKTPRVPHIVRWSPPSDHLQSFLVSYQHGFAILGHLVLGSYPGHGQAFLA